MDEVFKALADPNRRLLLDRLFDADGQTLGGLAANLPMTRFGAAKHLRVLETAGLVSTRKLGRQKLHYLNPVPIQLIHRRWVSKYAEPWAQALGSIKQELEERMEKPKHVYEVYIKTSPEQLWRALTDGEMTRTYFYESAVESDWKPGSNLTYRGPDGHETLSGEVIEIQPPKRLVTTFKFPSNNDRPSRVTWEIEQLGEACKLTLVHDDFDGETETYKGVGPGWSPVLSSLKTLLETGKPLAIAAQS